MDDKYIKIRKDILWKVIIVLIIILLAALLIFQICNRANKNEDTNYTPAEYTDVIYDDLVSRLSDNSGCFICGNHEQSLMPYYKKFDTVGIISLNDLYVIDLGLKSYDEVGNEITENGSTSIRSTSLDNVTFSINSTPSRGMASAKITLTDNYSLDTKNLEDSLCSDCLIKVADVLSHSYRKEEVNKETIPLCVIDFETLEVYSMQDYHRGYFVRDYWVELDFTDDEIEIDAYYLPVRE